MLSFFGGKSKMGEWIYQFIPKDISTYAEPFSGSFWVYFNTKLSYSHVKTIRYNDINKFTCNLFACAKDYNKFTQVINKELDPGGFLYADKSDADKYKQYYKDLYYSFKNDPTNTFLDDDTFSIPNYNVGMKYSFLITSSFNGCWPKSAGFSGVQGTKIKLDAFINKLKNNKYQAKLDKIDSFETLDFETFINKYDAEDTFFYLDPPYEDPKNNRLNWYGVKADDKFGRFSHKRLADLLKTTKSRWALSYYYYDDLELWFPKDKYTWITKDFFRSSASFSDNKDIKGTEVLILNYDPNLLINNEQLIDEIEEENGGAFIDSEKAEILNSFEEKLVSNSVNIDPEFVEIVNDNFDKLTNLRKNVSDALLNTTTENGEPYLSTDWVKENILKIEEKSKDDEIDDFWNS
jgi:DNA adenine methylase